MTRRYVIGKTSFPSKLAKDHWVLKGNIFALQDVLKLGTKNLTTTQRELIKLTIRQLSITKRQMEKKLLKQGYIKR